MRAGHIRHPAELLLTAGSPPQSQSLGVVWVGISEPLEQDAERPAGLRSRVRVMLRARYQPDIMQGRFIKTVDGRLFALDAVRNPDQRGQDMVISASELIGDAGEYLPSGATVPVPCRVFLSTDSPITAKGGKAEYRMRAELSVLEVGRLQPEALLTVAGIQYRVMGLVEESDDGAVRAVWVKPA